MALPILDLTDALAPGAPRSAEVARQLRAAAMSSGFFYVRQHGVDAAQVARQFTLAEQLLDLPPPPARRWRCATRPPCAASRTSASRPWTNTPALT